MSAPPSPSKTSTAASSRNASPAGSTRQNTLPARRPNRAALRDYYNLNSAAAADPNASSVNGAQQIPSPTSNHITSPTTIPFPHSSELDTEGFDAAAYIRGVLAGEGLEGVLRVEGGLINEIKGLDGERKALVYDNYSKLITATDTIRRMRKDMGTEMVGRGTLGPAVGHIAETTRALQERSKAGQKEVEKVERLDKEAEGKRRQRETVRWVLNMPRRLGLLLDEGKKEKAEGEWAEVRQLLVKWEGVPGVDQVRDECERIMGRKE